MAARQDWLKLYMRYTAHSEAPDQFHFWVGVGTIAAALRRKVWIHELYYDWTPNFYIVFIAPPGISTKSTALSIGQELLSQLGTIHFGPDSLTWQALVDAVSNAREDVLIAGKPVPMSCLTFFSSEMGSLIDLNDPKMMIVLTDLWDGKNGSWVRATRTSGSLVAVNPWLNMLMATTPAWLSENMPRSMINGGFVSRCVMVMSSSKRRYVPYPSREALPEDHARLKEELIRGLQEISMLKGEFKLTDEAYEWGSRWYEEHWQTFTKSVSPNDPIASYYARKQTHMHKLAMVLSASESGRMVIEARHLQAADAILSSIEQDAGRAIKIVQTTETMETGKEMIDLIHARGRILKSTLYRAFMHKHTYREFNELLNSVVQSGHAVISVEGRQELVVAHKPQDT